MTFQTRNQRFAQAAFAQVEALNARNALGREYVSFAKRFPALIHACGLAQAVAFAEGKGKPKVPSEPKPEKMYLDDLSRVLNAASQAQTAQADNLGERTRTVGLSDYLRLSRDAIQAASWLKRYAEALGREDE